MTTVSGIRGILAYHEYEPGRWNFTAPRGTPVIVTYNFTASEDLHNHVNSYYPGSTYSVFNDQQQASFQQAAEEFSQVSGIIFVEVEGPAMINIANGSNTGVGGYASYPFGYTNFESDFFGSFVIDQNGNYGQGTEQYGVLLHELGHAVGLSHTHDGPFVLDPAIDNPMYSVMTYNSNAAGGRDGLGTLDVAALEHLYGTQVNTNGWTIRQDDDEFVIRGTGRDESFFAVTQETWIRGRGGDDTIFGRGYDDRLIGGAGEDTIRGNGGDDVLQGNADADRIWGGEGSDIIRGGSGADALRGGWGDDVIAGGSGSDRLIGGFGQDTLRGNGGADRLQGQAGDDQLYGGGGDDRLSGASGENILSGGGGDDRLISAGYDDTLTGGRGADTFDIRSGSYAEITDFDSTEDRIVVRSIENPQVEVYDGVGSVSVSIYDGNSFSGHIELTGLSLEDFDPSTMIDFV